MIITGGSKGIGKACVQHFLNRYEVVSVSRHGDTTENGDLTDMKFLRQLIDKHPIVDVLINNAGGCRSSFTETNLLNYIAPVFLMEHYKKNSRVRIINIGSNAAYGAEAYDSGYTKLSDEIIWYCCSKNALKYASNALARKNPNIKICCIEPGKIGGKNLNLQDITKTIDWVLEQTFNVHSILLIIEEESLLARNSLHLPLF